MDWFDRWDQDQLDRWEQWDKPERLDRYGINWNDWIDGINPPPQHTTKLLKAWSDGTMDQLDQLD